MAKIRKLLKKLLSGSKNIRFDELVVLLEAFGFTLDRVTGSHHVFTHPDLRRPFPIQEVKGQAKPYQIRQFLKLIETYNLQLEAEPDDNEDKV
jgi:predicted RNA binding protein YcfA (HicA-like mRNA interferase family)